MTNEYTLVSGGLSPDGRWSIASHGNGEAGYDNFDLYLKNCSSNAKISPLKIDGSLDTAPLSIIAIWAPDSKHFVILHRIDRHVLDISLYAVSDGEVQQIKVPLLLDIVSKCHLKQGVQSELVSRLFRVNWQQSDCFTIQECDTFDAAEPIFNPGIEPYVTLDRLGSERTFTSFSAEAICKIDGKGNLHFDEVKALPNASWSNTIVYSPHILFDTQCGLHNTETTLSSLNEQKESKKP